MPNSHPPSSPRRSPEVRRFEFATRRRGQVADALFREKNDADEYIAVWRPVLTAPEIDEIKFSRLQELLVTSRSRGPDGEPDGRTYYALSTRQVGGSINLWATGSVFSEARPVDFWTLARLNDKSLTVLPYQIIQILRRDDERRLGDFSAVRITCSAAH